MKDIKYPVVDRSGFKPNFVKKDRDDSLDIAFTDGVFSDGRPFRIECWAANQVTYLTYYFSVIDIEDMSAADLKEYLISEHAIEFNDVKFLSSGFSGLNVEANKKTDYSGNEIWEVTVIVGDEDGTYINDKHKLHRYEMKKPNKQLNLFDLSDDPEEVEKILENAKGFALKWGGEQHGSVQDFVQAMTEKFGPKIRMYLVEIVKDISEEKGLTHILKQYFDITLSYEGLSEALGSKTGKKDEEQSSLDELFRRSIRLQTSKKYAEAIAFVSRLPKYSPYNNILVYLQNPNATFWATAVRWKKDFRRTIKEDSRPMLILAPMTPVLMVYDVLDTEGKPLPKWFSEFFKVEGDIDETILKKTMKNSLSHYAIKIVEKELGLTRGGSAISFDPNRKVKMRIVLKKDLDRRARYAILCHELAHIFLGHLGSDEDRWWPSRLNLTKNQREIEAESVAFIVCSRAGLVSHSAEYLAGYIKDQKDISKISIDMITKVAGRIENMGQKRLTKRTPKGLNEMT